MDLQIDTLSRAHWPAVAAIYRDGIATGRATFETLPPDWERWDRDHLPFARIVALSGGGVVGWAALAGISSREVYRGVAEVSVYVAAGSRGRGVGRALLDELIARSESNGVWTLQAGIFPENEASIALHASCGFRTVGVRRALGSLGGVWKDVVLMERRSGVAGV